LIRVVVCGACGRMGRLIVRQVAGQKDMRLVGAVEAPGAGEIGSDAGELAGVGKLGVPVTGAEKLHELLASQRPDVLVDFTNAASAVENVRRAAEAGVSVVVGTTGFTGEQREAMEGAIRKNGIRAVISPNMSVGVNVFFKAVEETARMLGREYEVEIVEVHHVHKRDAPSGTAKRVAQIVAGVLGKRDDEIKIRSIREGEVVGDHTVIFSGQNDRIEITHRALSRETFAAGVIKAIRYVFREAPPGKICDMQDVLGLGR